MVLVTVMEAESGRNWAKVVEARPDCLGGKFFGSNRIFLASAAGEQERRENEVEEDEPRKQQKRNERKERKGKGRYGGMDEEKKKKKRKKKKEKEGIKAHSFHLAFPSPILSIVIVFVICEQVAGELSIE